MTLTKKQIRALRRNTTPFGLLTKEMQAAFRESGGPIEYWYGNRWGIIVCPGWGLYGTYRLATPTEPALIPDVVPWDDIIVRWNYAARDGMANSWLFEAAPDQNDPYWIAIGGMRRLDTFANYRPGTTDWKDSLQIRPGVV